jgi:hypothetical protein
MAARRLQSRRVVAARRVQVARSTRTWRMRTAWVFWGPKRRKQMARKSG